MRRGADPQKALAVVLGLAAEDIQVKEAAPSGPPARANTVPNPNTEPVAQPSNGGPGFPSGDN